MKKILTLTSYIFIIVILKAQPTINPLVTTELCPNADITFTVTLPGAVSNVFVFPIALNVPPQVIQGAYNIVLSNGNTVFNFKGRFIDNNNKQTFKINYNDANNVAKTYEFSFTKIKSLLTANSFSQIVPNITSITSPPCQVNMHNISFNNVKFGNPWEAPPIGYGTITAYEYLLPIGWILNGVVSNGNNWITGNNNVTVTSDKSNSGSIKVRPVNDCAVNLVKGQEAIITITRPKPALTFSAINPICFSETYSASNIPAAFTGYNWQASPVGLVSIALPNATSTLITRLSDGVGNINFSISSPGCNSVFNYGTQEITGHIQIITGAPSIVTGINHKTISNDCYVPVDRYTAIGGTGSTNYKWYIRTLPNGTFTLKKDGPENFCDVTGGIPGKCIDIQVKVEASNNCNINTPKTFVLQSDQCRCTKEEAMNGARAMSITPNPAISEIQIKLVKSSTKSELKKIQMVKITNKVGNINKVLTGNQLREMTIQISELPKDIYTISIFDGNHWESLTFSKL